VSGAAGWPRIVLLPDGYALHILRPGLAPEVVPLPLEALAALAEDAAAALRAEVTGGRVLRRRRRPIEPVASEPAGAHYVGRLGE
jgi:hypothetical protein